MYTGGVRVGTEDPVGEWFWSDGSTYVDWHPGQPNALSDTEQTR